MSETEQKPIVLSVRNLAVDFQTEMGVVHAIDGVSFDVRAGETLAIVGESGSGKTTAMNAVLGLLAANGRVSAGEILFQGQDLAKANEKRFQKVRGAHIGLVPQDPMSNLNPMLRIGDQVGEVLLAHKKATKSTVKSRSIAALENAGLPDAARRLNQYPHEFSGGMRQRVLIGIGLACEPELLIADEPTSALDVTVQRTILDRLETMTRELDTAMILITHDLGLAIQRSDKVVVMYRGKVVEQGNSQDILNNPQHEYTQKLVNSAPSTTSVRLKKPSTDNVGAAQQPILTVSNLTKVFRARNAVTKKRFEFKAVDDVTFSMNRGSTLAIVGESGSGKSTTARMVLRLDDPTSGSIDFQGTAIASLSGRELKKLRKRVQPIFQDPYSSLNPMASIGEVLQEPLKIHGIGNRITREAKARELLEMVSLDQAMFDRYSSELSGGQRQRVAIARSLALNPELIICDEPVSALDVLVQAQILDLLAKLQDELNLSYLFISHDLAVVRMIADEVLVMRHGKVVERGLTEDLFNDPKEAYSQELLGAMSGPRGATVELGVG